jgi:hypothetical protein
MANGDRLIEYGSGPFQATITSEVFQEILQQFHGRTVLLGASYDNPPHGSLGAWLIGRLSGRNLAVYVGSILVHEGHAEWEKTESGISLRFLV